jgi:hypothetical protein
MIAGEGKFSGISLEVSLPNEHRSTYTVAFVHGAAEVVGANEAVTPLPANPEMKFVPRDSELVLMEANYFDQDFTVDGEVITIHEFEQEARRAIQKAIEGT